MAGPSLTCWICGGPVIEAVTATGMLGLWIHSRLNGSLGCREQ